MERRLVYVVDKEGISERVTADGIRAILTLAQGDMRKVLNVLQATAAGFPAVDATNVYACTGNPTPADVNVVLQSLLADDIRTAHNVLLDLMRRGFALIDVLVAIGRCLLTLEFPNDALRFIMGRLADIEHRLAFGTSDKIQGAALVAAFSQMRALIDTARK